jgi:ABC-type uncharacterized transport system substrate-binding protein
VLLVHSYHKEYLWCQRLSTGLKEALKNSSITIDTVYMDAQRQSAPEQLRQKAQDILQLIERTRPQVVIAADDAAQEYLVAPHLKGKGKPQVIFCGVNALPSQYGFPATNVSGVREHMHVREALDLLKKIIPGAHSVTLLTDKSETSSYVLEDMREDLRTGGPFPLKLKSVERVATFQEWQRLVQRSQGRAEALLLMLYNTLVDERTGHVVPPEEVMAWTRAANALPTAGLVDFAADHGVLCGVLESAQEQGYLAGSMTREVLAGTPAGKLPIRLNKRGVIFVNLGAAKRLGILVPYPIIEAAGHVIR